MSSKKSLGKRTPSPLAQTEGEKARAAAFDELEGSDFEVPVLHLFQGVGNEAAQYGKHQPGVWVNSLDNSPVQGEVIPIVPLKEVCVWLVPRGQGMRGRYPNRADIPTEVHAEAQAGRCEIVDVMSWFMLLRSNPDLPFVMRFKSTSLRTSRKVASLEKSRMRRREDRRPGAYQLAWSDASNDQGAWKNPELIPAGDCTDDEYALVEEFALLLSSASVKIVGEDKDDIPI